MKKILVLNQGETYNYGDNAINIVLSKALECNNFHVENDAFWSEKKVFGSKYDSYLKIFKWLLWHCSLLMDFLNLVRIKRVLKNKKYDAIIIGGGELLGCNYGFNSSLYMWTKIAQKKGIPVYLIGVSGSLDLPKIKLKRNKSSLKKCKRIYVRDRYTNDIISKVYDCKSRKIHDVVFAYNRFVGLEKTGKKKENIILVTPILFYDGVKYGLNLTNEDEYLDFMKKKLHEILNLNPDFNVIITCTDLDDEPFSKKFYYSLKNDKEILINNISFFPFTNLEDFLQLLNKSKIVISSRMHSMILGKIFGLEIFPITFKNKLKVFKDEYQKCNDMKVIEDETYDQLTKICNTIMNEVKEKKNGKF